MADFFDTFSADDAVELASLSQLMYELRENHNAVPRRYGVVSSEALLERIRGGTVSEHPAYEHYLAARVLGDTRDMVRGIVSGRLKEIKGPVSAAPGRPKRLSPSPGEVVAQRPEGSPVSLHPEIAEAIGTAFGPQHTASAELKQDALIVRLANGIVLTVRYAAPDAYSLRWTRDEAEAGIDTAPLHPGLATFPNHLHDADGTAWPDPITDPGASPAENVLLLIRALLEQPTLGGADAA